MRSSKVLGGEEGVVKGAGAGVVDEGWGGYFLRMDFICLGVAIVVCRWGELEACIFGEDSAQRRSCSLAVVAILEGGYW